jgi:flagellar motor switch/type III secretory pathway protein FliN
VNVSPFPYDALPALSRKEVRTLARLRQTLIGLAKPDVVERALGDIAGEPVTITVRRAMPLEASRIPALGVGILLSPSDAHGLQRAVFIDAETALAATLVARALKQRAPRIVDGGRQPSAELAGALAAIVHAALRRGHAGVPLRIVSAAPAAILARELAAVHGHVATIWLGIEVGGEIFDARVSLPMSELPPPPDPRIATLGLLEEAPIALPLVAATCTAGRDTLAALRPGDVFVVPSCPLRAAEGHLLGPVLLAPGGGEKAIAGELAEGGRLVLRTERVESCPWALDVAPPMTGETNPTLQVLDDAPVVVRVELGSVEMKAREWASLAPGDVITLGRKVGAPAVLRIAGVEVARGELVQVDGEYGVRIVR